jgi:ABC-type lipoprotein export system ATPase subunit
VIELDCVTKEYILDQESVVTPVRQLTFSVEKGEFILIVGRSGSGKTTVLNLMAGLVLPTSGHVYFDGASLSSMRDRDLARLRAGRMGFVFQFPSLLPSLNVLDNVCVPTMFHTRAGSGQARMRALGILERLGLAERSTAYPKQLSAGEQRRAVLARSMISGPDVILADEPTSDLDGETEQEIMRTMREIHASGTTIVMVSHSLDLVSYATRVLRMADGVLTPWEPGSP